MKKLLAIALVLTMLLPLVGIAEIDVDSLSYEELVALNEKVQLALFGRALIEGVELPVASGLYYVGSEIPAGTYIVSVIGEDIMINILTYLPDGEVQIFSEYIVSTSYIAGSYKVNLSDGMTLKILLSSQRSNGKIFVKAFPLFFSK